MPVLLRTYRRISTRRTARVESGDRWEKGVRMTTSASSTRSVPPRWPASVCVRQGSMRRTPSVADVSLSVCVCVCVCVCV